MNSGTMSYDTPSNGQKKDDIEDKARWGKYKPALKTLIPFRPTSTNPTTIPSATTGLLSYVTVSWLTALMWKALRTGLTKEDLWDLHDSDKAERNSRRLQRLWEEEKANMGKEASFSKVIWRFGKTRFCVCISLMVLTVFFQFLVPAWILQWILEFIKDRNEPIETGIALAILILVTQTIRNLSFCGLWMIGIHTGVRVEGAMQLMTYEKLLRLRNGGETILSKAITFCTNDQERVFECVAGGVLAVAAPIMFIMSIVYTTLVIGPWALLGNAVIFLFYPILGGVAACTANIRRKTVKQTNARVGLMTQILSSVRIIKLYGWEDSFASKVEGYRALEEQQLRRAAFLQSLTVTVTPMINIIASVVVFLGYTLSGNDLTAAEAFSIFSVFASLQFTVGTLPFAVRSIAEATVCFRNFQKYLDLPEYENITTDSLQCDHDSVIVIKDGDFAWENINNDIAVAPEPRRKKRQKKYDDAVDKNDVDANTESVALEPEKVEPEEQCLTGINIDIKRGKLIGISGSTGSGKSSLISAILGDVKKLKGDVLLRGSLAYVSQQAWIYSDSFQDNILFGSPMNKEKYEKVLEVCCLKEDLAMLPDKDKTIVGDRGMTLSGGQKQRLNLARSIYSDRSIYLLDDPLSAVDSVVGKAIFQKCIKDYLADKTVLLVTHGVEFLEKCDEVLFIKNGIITERGKHDELIRLQHDYYNLCQYTQRNEKVRRDSDTPIKETSKLEINGSMTENVADILTSTVQDEIRYKNAGWGSFVEFIKAGGGWLLALVMFTLLLSFAAVRIFTTVFLQYWIDSGDGLLEERLKNATLLLNETLDSNETYVIPPSHELKGNVNDNPRLGEFQGIIAASVLLAYIIGICKGLLTTRFVLRAGTTLHNQMFARIMKCPISFFDSNPQGRIVSRFSKDMDELDARLPFFFEFVAQALIYIFATIFVICFIFPLLSAAMLVIFAVMIFLGAWLTIGVKQTKELDNALKAPVVGHLQSSMHGRTIIRTFNRQAVFQKRFAEHVNRHLCAEAVFRIANRWFTVRMDIIGLSAIFSTVLFGIFMRERISPAEVGLAFASIYTISTFVPFVFRLLSELNARFTSVERILEYGQSLEIESEPEKPIENIEGTWPSKGEIAFESVVMRYRADLPIVLNGISFNVKGGEKIGIVGRTGAGKSSIVSCLLRLNDLDSGRILIDGVDTSAILRKTLRQSIAVIPQDPVLFEGSIRYNVDPFNKHTDEEIWDALGRSNLKDKISKLKKTLLSEVDSEGSNLSVGEKQLICLTRSILRKNKILVLDEATSSIDVETDALIQATIKSTFADCTVLTIAHRLNTIQTYDRIIVLDKGELLEFDTPVNLMLNQGIFYKMMKVAGIDKIQGDQVQDLLPKSSE